jgi:hypothetical protein
MPPAYYLDPRTTVQGPLVQSSTRTKTPTVYENGKPALNFTRVANELIDSQNLSLHEKLVFIKLMSHAYGDAVTAYPSQLEISKCLKMKRDTVRVTLESLTALGLVKPHGEGHQGKQETYTLHPDRIANMPKRGPSNMPKRGPSLTQTCPIGDHKAYSIRPSNKTPADNEAISEIEVTVKPRGTSTLGNAVLYQDEEHAQTGTMLEPAQSGTRFTKRQINELLLAPDGIRPNANPDDVSYDLNVVLCEAQSPNLFNQSELDKLIKAHGSERCAFWVSWLLRKIASEYDVAGKPVENPAGLYRRAVEQGWEVDPRWPEFNKLWHTDAAWKIKHGIGTGTGPPLDSADVDYWIPF